MDDLDDLQCEDVYGDTYMMENDFEDDYDSEMVTYDDLIDRDCTRMTFEE